MLMPLKLLESARHLSGRIIECSLTHFEGLSDQNIGFDTVDSTITEHSWSVARPKMVD